MLYLVATPIGHLKDFSVRAVETLSQCDYILCEDTRHSATLLNRYEIKAPLKSFHRFNLKASEEKILSDLREGKTVGLISDAGTPLISDPGEELVAACIKEGLAHTFIPGPCAVTAALVLSGLPCIPFQFLGFLPKQQTALAEVLEEALLYPGTTIAYDPPHHIEDTLTLLNELEKERQLCIVREITKKHEECLRGTPATLLEHFKTQPPLGEMVLLLSPPQEKRPPPLPEESFLLSLETHLHLSRKEALKLAAKLTGCSKKDLYKRLLNNRN